MKKQRYILILTLLLFIVTSPVYAEWREVAPGDSTIYLDQGAWSMTGGFVPDRSPSYIELSKPVSGNMGLMGYQTEARGYLWFSYDQTKVDARFRYYLYPRDQRNLVFFRTDLFDSYGFMLVTHIERNSSGRVTSVKGPYHNNRNGSVSTLQFTRVR